jgi:hypothetical protein
MQVWIWVFRCMAWGSSYYTSSFIYLFSLAYIFILEEKRGVVKRDRWQTQQFEFFWNCKKGIFSKEYIYFEESRFLSVMICETDLMLSILTQVSHNNKLWPSDLTCTAENEIILSDFITLSTWTVWLIYNQRSRSKTASLSTAANLNPTICVHSHSRCIGDCWTNILYQCF